MSFEDRKEISTAVRYLVEPHGEEALDSFFGVELPTADSTEVGVAPSGADTTVRREAIRHREARGTAAGIVASLGIGYVDRWRGRRGKRHFRLRPRLSMGRGPGPDRFHVFEGSADDLRAALRLESVTSRREPGPDGVKVTKWRGLLLFGPVSPLGQRP